MLAQGFLEYWDGTSYAAPSPPTISFNMKLDTNLFDLAKAKTVSHCIEVRLWPGFACKSPSPQCWLALPPVSCRKLPWSAYEHLLQVFELMAWGG